MVDIKQVKLICKAVNCGHIFIPRKASVNKCPRCQKKGMIELVKQDADQKHNEAIANHNENRG